MASYFTLTLDTTAPTLAVSATQDAGDVTLVTLALVTDDAVEMKVWGAIDPTDPLNSTFAIAESDAIWVTFDSAPQVRVHPLGGTLHVKVRDDVDNEAAGSVQITTGAEAPPPPPAHKSPPGKPAPKPHVETRTVATRSRVRLRTSYDIDREAPPPEVRPTRSRIVVRTRGGHSSDSSPNVSRVVVRSRGQHQSQGAISRTSLTLRSHPIVVRQGIGPDLQTALVELDIL